MLYDYLQCWWRVLLLLSALGILGAYLVNEPKVYAKVYSATATVAIIDPSWPFELSSGQKRVVPPELRITITSDSVSKREAAVAEIEAKISALTKYTGTLIGLRNLVVDEWDSET